MLNNNLKREEAVWLINEFAPYMGGRIDGDRMNKYWVPARSLMMGKQVDRPGCSCEFKAYVAMTNSMYSQYETEIREIAYPTTHIEPNEIKVTTKRGRKKTL